MDFEIFSLVSYSLTVPFDYNLIVALVLRRQLLLFDLMALESPWFTSTEAAFTAPQTLKAEAESADRR